MNLKRKKVVAWLLTVAMVLGICQNLIAGSENVQASLLSGSIVSASAMTTDSIISPQVDGKQVTFAYYQEGLTAPTDKVSVAGSFNDWNNSTDYMTQEANGIWSITLNLPYGVSQYKFVVNSDWKVDPANPDKTAGGDPNSVVVVPGIVMPFYEDVQQGSEMVLPEQVTVYSGAGASQAAAAYTLESSITGVTLLGRTLQVTSEVAAGTQVPVKVSAGGIETLINVDVVAQVYTYTINYLRKAGDYDNWNMWMWNIGATSTSFGFNKGLQTDNYIQAQYKFSSNTINFITRKSEAGNEWVAQEAEGVITVPVGQTAVEVWMVQGNPTVFYTYPTAEDLEPLPTRYVVFEYTRPDGDYGTGDDRCNIWVWGTGATNGQIDFTEFKDGKAIAYIEMGPASESLGYKVRKGTNWDTCVVDIDVDRAIITPANQVITKAKVTYGVNPTVTVAPTSAPKINPADGTIKFYYRDDTLFKVSKMHTLKGVKVTINGQEYDMTYNAANELYEYTYSGLAPGKYYYNYSVTDKDDVTITVLDRLNKVKEDGKSVIEYKKMNIAVSGTVAPSTISYAQNAVLEISAAGVGEDLGKEISIKSITADLTALGGKSNVEIDKDLKAITIAVPDTIPAGVKQIPISLTDDSSNVYGGLATVEVRAKTAADRDHFDWDEAIIYFMLTDRFNNGDTSNDDPYGNNYKKEDRGTYQGGDLKGVTAKLDYLKSLGVNTIWITPVVDNIAMNVLSYENAYVNRPNEVGNDVSYYGYHGYWAKDFERLNPHLGTLADFHALIDGAHNKGMKIMVDIVVNHSGYGLKQTDTPSSLGATGDIQNFPTETDQDRFDGMLRAGGTDSVLGELANLPDFITEDPVVRKKIVDWQVNWVDKLGKTAAGNTIDYFRIDTAKHVEPATLMSLKNELTKVKPNFKYIVEAWLSAPDVDRFLNSGTADSAINFDFKQIARDFINGNINTADTKLDEINNKLNSAYTYGNFLSSHDENGFLWSLEQAGKADPEALMKLAASIQMTAKGQPVVYYGEEIGQSGANNWPYYDNRYNMDWESANDTNDMLTHYKKMINLRARYSQVFAKGSRTKIAGGDTDNYLAFERAYANSKVVVVINNGVSKEIILNVPFVAGNKVIDEYTGKEYAVAAGNLVTLTLPEPKDGGTMILTLKQVSSPSSSGSTGGGGAAPVVTEPAKENVVPGVSLLSKADMDKLIADSKDNTLVLKPEAGKSGVAVSTEQFKMLQEKGLDLKIAINGITIVFNANAIPAGALADGGTISFKQTEASGVKADTDSNMNALSKVFNLEIQATNKDGDSTGIREFNEPISVTLPLDSSKLNLIKDKRKVGVYYVQPNGDLKFMGGKIENGTITFKTPHFSNYVVMEYNKTFEDLGKVAWAKSDIEVLVARHITTGATDKTFNPSGVVTRAQFAVLLSKAIGIDPTSNKGKFKDIIGEDIYSGYITALNEKGLMNGYSDGTFKPTKQVTRQEIATLITNAYLYLTKEKISDIEKNYKAPFNDMAQVPQWAVEGIKAAQALEIIGGTGNNNFSPKKGVTRAETAKMIITLLGKAGQF